MKVLVTGANGLLGQKLLQLLDQDPGIHAIATAASPLRISLKNTLYRKLDITDPEEIENVISSLKPEVVINTAAMTHVDQCETNRDACWKVNTLAVKMLADACARHNTHIMQLSTDFIFDGSYGPLAETAIPNPVNYYGESKLEAERIIQQSLASWCIIRTVLVYGISADLSRANIVLWVKKSLEEGKSIQVVDDQYRTPTLAEDLAMGCHLAALKKASGIFHISGKDFLTPYEMAIQTADFFNLDKSLITRTDSTQFTQPAKRPLRTGFKIEKARKILGYEPHSFHEGLAIISKQLEQLSNA